MKLHSQAGSVLRFGTFELDLAAGELHKAGLRVRLQEQPFRLLALLVQRPGEVLSREELREKLWPADTYVDFDNSLNTAASKLREALGDSASSPRFVETLPRRGYRFLASVQKVGEPAAGEENKPARPNESSPQAVVSKEAASDSGQRRRLRITVAGSLVIVAAVAAALLAPRTPTATNEARARSTKFSVAPGMEAQHTAISPDGRQIVFSQSLNPFGNPARSRPEQGAPLWVQGLDEWEPRALEGTQGAWEPFWSPDSQWIAFFQEGALKKVAAAGGAIVVLCRAPSLAWFGAWSSDGSSLFFADGLEGRRLYRVSALGGEPELVFDPEGEDIQAVSSLPVEAGKQALLYSVPSGMGVVNLETGEHRLFASGFRPVYSATGHVLFRASRLISGVRALPFSLKTLQPTGDPFPIAQEAWSPSVSNDGSLVYIHSSEEDLQLAWRNRNGDKLSAIGGSYRTLRYPVLSPDERYIAFSALEGNSAAVWTHDIARSVTTRIAHSSRNDLCPLWSPSADEVVFSSWRDGNADIFRRRADGGGDAIPVVATEWKEFATDWSADGKYIFYDRSGRTERNEIWYVEQVEQGQYELSPFLAGESDQRAARLSPDGKYLAYVSDETGTYEVWVTTFPDRGRKWKVSSDGGMQPLWSKSTKELYYVDDYTLHAVSVRDEGGLALGTPQPLFQAIGFGGSMVPRYDVSADGRFLVREPVSDASSAIRVVQNWFVEFRDR